MSVPNTPAPPIVSPTAPVATAGATVIPKTKDQQKRSAVYTWLVSAGLGLVAIAQIFVQVAPQLEHAFPAYAKTIGMVAATVGAILLATQRQNSAGNEATVNYTEPPGE